MTVDEDGRVPTVEIAPDPAGVLCTSCGLCCDGALFDYVEVEEDERERLTTLGLVVDDRRGRPAFDQPCSRLAGTLCGIYAERPATCRVYRCELLKAVVSGQLPVESAAARIAEAKAIERQVLAGLPAGRSLAQSRSLLRGDQAAIAHEAGERPQLLLDFYRLNLILDRYFRRPGRQMLASRDGAGAMDSQE